MIKFSLHPTQFGAGGFTPREVDTPNELVIIEEMMRDGSMIHARTFLSPQGENVTVFWTVDAADRVATVWEHTYRVLTFNAPNPGDAEESAVLQEADAVSASAPGYPDDEYARGEA